MTAPDPMREGTPQLCLSVQDITKRFPGVLALDNVSLEIAPGEVHALLGENGAGKSTLLKILSGAETSDAGTITFGGRILPPERPLDRQARGIATIYQEFSLLPELSIAENVFLGREPLQFGFVQWRQMFRETSRILERLGITINPRTPVARLSIAEQQMIEIARALSMRSDLIVMDEPTAALGSREVKRLHAIVNDLRRQNIAILYITHRLEEVPLLCDRFSVLRDGRLVGAGAIDGVETDDLVRMMVGRDVEFERQGGRAVAGSTVLEARGLRTRLSSRGGSVSLKNVSIEIRSGEVLGIAGLVGAGRTELARALFGADSLHDGELLLDGEKTRLRSPRDAIRRGIFLVPEDRKQQALFLTQSACRNLTLPSLKRLLRMWWFVDERAEERLLDEYRGKLNIRMATGRQLISSLSGGNQQKVVLSRLIACRPKVLILDEPTRGVDVGAKAEIHQILVDLARRGVAVVVISSELAEVMAISDRVITMREGCITGELNALEATEETLMSKMAIETIT